MKNNFFSNGFKLIIFIFIILFLAGTIFLAGYCIAEKEALHQFVPSLFDITIIEAQETVKFDKGKGTIRMVNGWCIETFNGLIEDEQGNIWIAEGSYLKGEALLLWITDNHTPDNIADDEIMKVWRET